MFRKSEAATKADNMMAMSDEELMHLAGHMNFNLGNVLRLVWSSVQGRALADLKLARDFLDREIQRLEKGAGGASEL